MRGLNIPNKIRITDTTKKTITELTQYAKPNPSRDHAADAIRYAVEVMGEFDTTRCLMCGRRMKKPESIIQGYGPTCYKKKLKGLIEQSKMKYKGSVYDVRKETNKTK